MTASTQDKERSTRQMGDDRKISVEMVVMIVMATMVLMAFIFGQRNL
jgi:hypothetical protein